MSANRHMEAANALRGAVNWNSNGSVQYIAAALAKAEQDGIAAERERIVKALEEEADLIPCAEDAMVTRANARLIRADFSYEEADKLAAAEAH